MSFHVTPGSATHKNLDVTKGSGPLTQREERALAQQWQKAGDRRALERLIRAHLGLVVKIAREFQQSHLPLEDLVQEGNVGLTIAARRFDPRRSTRLSTYAGYWIRACMMEHVVRTHGPVRIGTTRAQRRIFFHLGRARRRLEQRGLPCGIVELAAELDVAEDEVAAMLPRLTPGDVSLDGDPWDVRGLGTALIPRLPTPEEACTDRQEVIWHQNSLAQALRRLEPRERDIINARHLREKPETLAELGQRFGLSRERVRQLEARAKDRIRQLCGEGRRRPWRRALR